MAIEWTYNGRPAMDVRWTYGYGLPMDVHRMSNFGHNIDLLILYREKGSINNIGTNNNWNKYV